MLLQASRLKCLSNTRRTTERAKEPKRFQFTIGCGAVKGTAKIAEDGASHHQRSSLSSRRQFFMLSSASALLLAQQAIADDQNLPKAYKAVVEKLIKSLRESIQAEQAGDKEFEVRRKADPAKEALQMFVKRWRDDPKVKDHPSHAQVVAVLAELGAFYQKSGPRAKMPPDVQTRLLGYLQAAENSLSSSKPLKSDLKVPGTSLFDDVDDDLRELLPST